MKERTRKCEKGRSPTPDKRVKKKKGVHGKGKGGGSKTLTTTRGAKRKAM